jgi:hypothetical protein
MIPNLGPSQNWLNHFSKASKMLKQGPQLWWSPKVFQKPLKGKEQEGIKASYD